MKTRVLAITGGIGSGKSYVSRLLTQHFGIPVYDCDTEAKRLNTESEEVRSQLEALVGKEVYKADGTLCRPVLANYLFASPDNARCVNAITHPAVAKDFRQWVLRQTCPLVGMECAILFESGFDRLADSILCVSAPHDLCLARAMQRDGASREAIERRMALQMDTAERERRSDYVILNDGHDLAEDLHLLLSGLQIRQSEFTEPTLTKERITKY